MSTNATMNEVRELATVLVAAEKALEAIDEQLENARGDLGRAMGARATAEAEFGRVMVEGNLQLTLDGAYRALGAPPELAAWRDTEAPVASASVEVQEVEQRRQRLRTAMDQGRQRLGALRAQLTPGQRLQTGEEAPDYTAHRERLNSIRERHALAGQAG